MADDVYYLDDLIGAGIRFVTDDGSGTDWIVITQTHLHSLVGQGYYGVRVFLDWPVGSPGQAFAETTQETPLLYRTVTFTGLIENATGGAGVELLSGNALANVLQGDPLDQIGQRDDLFGNGGHDTLLGVGGGDLLNGGTGNDVLFGDIDPEQQDQGNFNSGDDTLVGDDGDDRLVGGLGNNDLYGGNGIDTADYAVWSDTPYAFYWLDADLTQGRAILWMIDTYDGSAYAVAHDTLQSIEVIRGTAYADSITLADTILPGDWTVRRAEGGAGNDDLTGSNGADDLFGGDGDDSIGSGGNVVVDYVPDRMFGGRGNDTYRLSGPAEIHEAMNEGIDTVIADRSHVLGYNLERLVLAEVAGAASGTGNVWDNHITGNSAANQLRGGTGGLDTLEGLGGNDRYFTDFGDMVIESANGGHDTVLTSDTIYLAEHVEDVILQGTAAIYAHGSTGANRITGNAANNTLAGGLGADTLVGGDGHDQYLISYPGDAADRLIETETGGRDEILTQFDYVLTDNVWIEDLTVWIWDGLDLTGNRLDNRITGNRGDDALSGRLGHDSLSGGGGNDTVDGGLGNDVLGGGNGVDLAQFLSGAAIRVDLSRAGVQQTGEGADRISGIENLLTGAGHDHLTGSGGDNYLQAGAGNDTIIGGDGNDWLLAEAGIDRLTGGNGADVFVFGGDLDTVTDFQNGLDAIVIGSFDSLRIIDSGANTVLRIGDHRMVLLNTDHLLIDINDFLFA